VSRRAPLFARWNFNTTAALGCFLLGLAILLLVPSQVDEPPRFFGQTSSGISPKLFPRLAAIGLMAIGALYFVASFRMAERGAFGDMPRGAYLNVLFVLAAMALYVALLRPLGYVLSSALVATTISLFYGSRNPVGVAAVGLGAPLAIYYLFTRWLTVSLPPFPWG
jgi:hypothetical protein